ncbi:hypothetical protein BAE44_0012361, partial [Dichanthelium oligosanthes]
LACSEGLRLAAEWCNEKVILETDCKSLVAILQNKEGLKSRLYFIIREVQAERSRLSVWKVERANREQNRTAHELAALRACVSSIRLGLLVSIKQGAPAPAS